jgi:hypothetical protein
MALYSDYNINEIVEALIQNREGGLGKFELPRTFFEQDLRKGVSIFENESKQQHDRWKKMLCIKPKGNIEYPIPIAVQGFYDNRKYWKKFPFNFIYPMSELRKSKEITKFLLESTNIDVHEANLEEAKSSFRFNLKKFVRSRLFGLNKENSNPFDRGGECEVGKAIFTVITRKSNLRILYDPVFLFGQGEEFGFPSPEVRNCMKPGDYIFGADGPDQQTPIWEADRVYSIPDERIAHLMKI